MVCHDHPRKNTNMRNDMNTDLTVMPSILNGYENLSSAPSCLEKLKIAALVVEILQHSGRRSASQSRAQLIRNEVKIMNSKSREREKIEKDRDLLIENKIPDEIVQRFVSMHFGDERR